MAGKKTGTFINILVLTAWKGVGVILSVAIAVLIANFFGATAATDAYFFARKLVSNIAMGFERAFHLVQVPPLVDRAMREGMTSLRVHLRRLSVQTMAISSLMALFGIYFAAPIIATLAPGFDADQVALTEPMLQILLLTIPISAVTGLTGATLNALRLFSLPAIARLLPRLFIVLALLFMPRALGISILPWAMLLGAICMGLFFAWAIIKAFRNNTEFTAKGDHATATQYGKRRVFAMVFAQFHMIGASWIDMAFASVSGTGGVATLEFGQRLTNVAPGVAANSVTSVYYSEFSRAVAANDTAAFRAKLAQAMRTAFFFAVPLAAVIFPLAGPAVGVVLQHGAFSDDAATATTQVVQILALLLPINAVLGVTVSAIFADPKLPHIKVILSSTAVAIAVRVAIAATLIDVIGLLAVPISSLLAMSVLFILCYGWVSAKTGAPLKRADFSMLLSVLAAGVLCFGVAAGILQVIQPADASKLQNTAAMGGAAFGGLIAFLIAVCMFRVSEATDLLNKIKRKLRR